MAPEPKRVKLDLDAEMVRQARSAFGADAASDAAVVERVLNSFLMRRFAEDAQSRSDLKGDQADLLATEELQAMRRERDAA